MQERLTGATTSLTARAVSIAAATPRDASLKNMLGQEAAAGSCQNTSASSEVVIVKPSAANSCCWQEIPRTPT
eukprot:13044-Heterococcus_DN1.PRE.3